MCPYGGNTHHSSVKNLFPLKISDSSIGFNTNDIMSWPSFLQCDTHLYKTFLHVALFHRPTVPRSGSELWRKDTLGPVYWIRETRSHRSRRFTPKCYHSWWTWTMFKMYSLTHILWYKDRNIRESPTIDRSKNVNFDSLKVGLIEKRNHVIS